jgi:hypothetical protein
MKAPEHGFYIYCEYELGGGQKKATWLYDPKRLALIPENEAAISLSSGDRIATPAPKLRPVQTPASEFTSNLADTVEIVRQPPQATPAPVASAIAPEEAFSDTADLLEALRKKRNDREILEHQDHEPQTDFLSVVPDFEEQESFVDEDVNQDPPEVTADPPPVSKRGRASIPSWDEIVFGTKTED